MDYEEYLNQLVTRFWHYRGEVFTNQDGLFDQPARLGNRAPVFCRNAVTHNVLFHPDLDQPQRDQVLALLPPWQRHRWFRSMRSSQALAQSVFANLYVLGALDSLSDVTTEEGQQPFRPAGGRDLRLELEHEVDNLGELPNHHTFVDVFVWHHGRVSIECKLTETGIGACSRPKLDPNEPDHCDGSFTLQHGRMVRCSLTGRGIEYWDIIPQILNWNGDIDLAPCPLNSTYQIVRNILAACVTPAGKVELDAGVTVLLIDKRNPKFQPGGIGRAAYDEVKQALHNQLSLQLCTWQNLVAAMEADRRLNGLTIQLRNKYGF